MKNTGKYGAIVALIIVGVVAVFLFMGSRDSAPNEYAAMTKACKKADEVTDYDITQHTEYLVEDGQVHTIRREHQISSGNVFTQVYNNDGTHQGDTLYIDNEVYARPAGGKWEEYKTKFDLVKAFRQFPYDGASLCSDLQKVSSIGDGTVGFLPVKRYKTGSDTITDFEKRVGYKVFSIDGDGWLRQVDHIFGSNDIQDRKDRSVFSGLGEPNDIPDPETP